jgi:hypothetical protein
MTLTPDRLAALEIRALRTDIQHHTMVMQKTDVAALCRIARAAVEWNDGAVNRQLCHPGEKKVYDTLRAAGLLDG